MILPHHLEDKRVILASSSPRRHHLMRELGIDFEVITPDVEEDYPNGLTREEIAVHIAKLKAGYFGEGLDEHLLIITADTIVVKGNRILTKPENEKDAREMLRELSGDSHEVITAVCLRKGEQHRTFYDNTKVHFRDLTDEEIDHYIRRYKPFDKAGAYGIQEWIGYIGIDRIEGSYFNVMGLPVHKVYEELKEVLGVR